MSRVARALWCVVLALSGWRSFGVSSRTALHLAAADPLWEALGALDAINTSIDMSNNISDIVLDKKAVDAATYYITDNQDEMIKYGSDTVTTSLQQLAAYRVAQSETAQRIKTMTLKLSKNSANMRMLLAHVDTSTGKLDASSRKMLSASLTLLSSMLKTAVNQSAAAVGAFEALESQATQLQATLQVAVLHFKAEQDDASATMTLKVKATLQAFSDSMNRFQSAFSAFSTVAASYASSAKSSVAALGDYVSVVKSAESFVDATSDLYVSSLLVDNYNAQLSEIANATADLIAKISSRDLASPDVRPVPTFGTSGPTLRRGWWWG
jgi:hypothetical protein